jgi:hypothetical protein
MKIFIKYKTDGYKYDQKFVDTDMMLYEGHVLPSGKALLRQVVNLQDLGYLIEKNRSIFVLHEPMELDGGQIEYDAVEFNISFIINPSSIAMVFPDRSGRGIIEKREKENKEAELNVNVEYRDHVCVPNLNGQECSCCAGKVEEEEKKDFWLCGECGAQLPECFCSPSTDYIGSTPQNGLTD